MFDQHKSHNQQVRLERINNSITLFLLNLKILNLIFYSKKMKFHGILEITKVF